MFGIEKAVLVSTLMLVGLGGVAAGNADEELVLAKDGVARQVITVANDASVSEKHAAKELASFLRQVTGAEFALKTPAEAGKAPQIAVGPGAARVIVPGISLDGLDDDGILIKAVSPSLVLTGGPGAARGTLYSVYTFLEDQVGCRWWTRSDSVIPKKPTLSVTAKLDTRFVPPIWRREVYFLEGANPDWCVRNKINAGYIDMKDAARGGAIEFAGRSCHTFYLLVPPSKYFDKHPEWFAEINGKRVPEGSQLCLTNPEVAKVAAETAREWLRANPRAKMVAVDQNDYHLNCTCAKCKAVDEEEGGPSGSNIRFANAVAAELEKEFPGVWIETFAYGYTRKPPRLAKPRDNVVVRLCSIECDFAHPLTHPNNKEFREDIEGWSKICKQLLIWDYVSNFYHYLQAHPNFRVLGPNIRFFRDHSVKGIFEQGNGQSLGASGAALKTWVISKLLWNPDLDDSKLIDEFIDGYYGPAAPKIRDYFDLIHDDKLVEGFQMGISVPQNAPYLASPLLAKSAALLDEAKAAAAADSPEFLRRVEIVELGVLYSLLVNDFDEFFAKGAVPDKEKFLARLERFETIANREKITHVAEGGDLLPDWVKRIRGVVSGGSLPQTEWTASLKNGEAKVLRLEQNGSSPPIPTRPATGTDGMRRSSTTRNGRRTGRI